MSQKQVSQTTTDRVIAAKLEMQNALNAAATEVGRKLLYCDFVAFAEVSMIMDARHLTAWMELHLAER